MHSKQHHQKSSSSHHSHKERDESLQSPKAWPQSQCDKKLHTIQLKTGGPPIHGSLSPDWGSGISTCCQFCNNNANSTLVDWHYTGLLMQVNWPSRVNSDMYAFTSLIQPFVFIFLGGGDFSIVDTKTNSEKFGKFQSFLV